MKKEIALRPGTRVRARFPLARGIHNIPRGVTFEVAEDPGHPYQVFLRREGEISKFNVPKFWLEGCFEVLAEEDHP